jgi:hypothetical protein
VTRTVRLVAVLAVLVAAVAVWRNRMIARNEQRLRSDRPLEAQIPVSN